MAFVDSPKNPHITPGPQMPEKYGGHVGDNYRHYGELTDIGWNYNPRTDQYEPDYQWGKDQAKKLGIYRPAPGILAQIAPLAAAAGGVGLAGSLARDPGGWLGGIANLFGLGSGTKTAKDLTTPLSTLNSQFGNFDLGASLGGESSLASAGGDLAPGAAIPASVSSDALDSQLADNAPGFFGSVAPYLGAAGGALGAFGLGKQLLSGKSNPVAGAESGAALGGGLAAAAPLLGFEALGPVGLAAGLLGGGLLGGGLGMFGHGPNYYAGQDRGDAFDRFAGGKDTLSLPEAGGGTFGLTRDALMHDPTTYNQQAGVTPDIQAKANTMFGLPAGGNPDADTLQNQLAQLGGNMLAAGVDPSQVQSLATSGLPPSEFGASLTGGSGPITKLSRLMGIANASQASSPTEDPMKILMGQV